MKARDPRQRRRQNWPNTGEREWDESDVSLSIKRVDRQLRRHQPLQLLRGNLPVQKKKVMPILVHHHLRIRLERRGDTIDRVNGSHQDPALQSAFHETRCHPPRAICSLCNNDEIEPSGTGHRNRTSRGARGSRLSVRADRSEVQPCGPEQRDDSDHADSRRYPQ